MSLVTRAQQRFLVSAHVRRNAAVGRQALCLLGEVFFMNAQILSQAPAQH
jgi:hypothetical protein